MDRPGIFDDDALAVLYLDLTTQAHQNGLQGDDIEPWIAQELVKRVEDDEIIRSLLRGQDPEAYASTLLPVLQVRTSTVCWTPSISCPQVRAA